jgi:hypothetical protein
MTGNGASVPVPVPVILITECNCLVAMTPSTTEGLKSLVKNTRPGFKDSKVS